jgi:hypothetical protein
MAESHKSLAQGNTPCEMDDTPLSQALKGRNPFFQISFPHIIDYALSELSF